MKKLTVITRTSGRPNHFKKSWESVKSQDYENLRHVVLVDDNNDNSYVHDYDGSEFVFIKSKDFEHFDEYLNAGLNLVPRGELFCVMDDDDRYTETTSLSQAVDALGDKELVLFQVSFPYPAEHVHCGALYDALTGDSNTLVLPHTHQMVGENKYIEAGTISMLGFVMNTNFAYGSNGEMIKFPARHGGDFGFLNRCTRNNCPPDLSNQWMNSEIAWLPKVLATVQRGHTGLGLCNDI